MIVWELGDDFFDQLEYKYKNPGNVKRGPWIKDSKAGLSVGKMFSFINGLVF